MKKKERSLDIPVKPVIVKGRHDANSGEKLFDSYIGCGRCHREVFDNYRYCPECGGKIGW